jgi:HrpA-like RNA helicase
MAAQEAIDTAMLATEEAESGGGGAGAGAADELDELEALFASALGSAPQLAVKRVAEDATLFSWYDQEDQPGGGTGAPSEQQRLAALGGEEAPDYTLEEIAGQRASLPAYRERRNIVRTVVQHPTTVISGETGCGKTTQVPQYLLDYCDQHSIPCNIICTQPRRISAMSVAERVASERGERCGDTVGYSIRLESVCSARTRLMFCTTGILLRRMEEDPTLGGVTHVVVDEVHERSEESDFILMVLRDIQAVRPAGEPLRVICMSATLNSGQFASYFADPASGAPAPCVHIPGRTFPVEELYLEAALAATAHVLRPKADWARRMSPGRDSMVLKMRQTQAAKAAAAMTMITGAPAAAAAMAAGASNGGKEAELTAEQEEELLLAAAYDEAAEDEAQLMAQISAMARKPPPAGGAPGGAQGGAGAAAVAAAVDVEELADSQLTEEELGRRYAALGYGTQVAHSLYLTDPEQLNAELVRDVVAWLVQGADGARLPQRRLRQPLPIHPRTRRLDGAILVFLPGLKEIMTVHELLLRDPAFSGADARRWLLPLHSSLSSQEQKLVFRRPPAGVTKVVLATNIAETSITIDDVVCVVDTGRMKEARYDAMRKMASLEDVIVSKANARQRAGRAGRVRAGLCIHLYSAHTAARLAPQQLPEIQRVPLEQLCLRIKVLGFPGTVASVLAKVMEPPAAEAVEKAINILVELDAMDRGGPDREQLTSLGHHLAALPTDVRIGKLLLYGAMLGCIDPVLTIAAALSYRSPFIAPFDKRREADESKRQFSKEVLALQASRGQVLGAGRGQQSDHLTLLVAYNQWNALRGMGKKYAFCHQRYLHAKTMDMIAQTKRQFVELLSDARFLPPRLRQRQVEAAGRRQGGDGVAASVGAAANQK